MLEKVNENNSANLAQAFHLMQPPVPDENTPPAQMNAVRVKDDELLKYLKKLQSQVASLSQRLNETTTSNTDKSTTSKINPKTGKEWKRYCWTCCCTWHWVKTVQIQQQNTKTRQPSRRE